MKRIFYSLLALHIALASCNTKNNESKQDFLASNLDTTVNPAEDFFMYANGGWIKNNAIPAAESSWGIGNMVIEENNQRLRKINEDAARENAKPGTASQKIGDFWIAAMDSAGIEKKGLEDLKPYFAKIDAISSAKDLPAAFADLHKIGVGTVVGLYVGQDDKNSDAMSLKFWQYGLYLPEREYYFKTDSTALKIIAAYKNLVSKFLLMSGMDATVSLKAGDNIFNLEKKLAAVHRKMADLRDPVRNYNKMSADAFYKLAPNLQTQQMFAQLNIPKTDSVIVGQPEYYTTLNSVIASTPIDVWKAYLRFRLIDEFTEALPDAYGKEKFNYSKLLSGATERKPRWKRVLRNEENVMGELLGQLFAKEYFNEKAKKRYSDLVESIRSELKTRIEKLDWMSAETKQKALAKLAVMKKKVGYPDKWKDFSGLNITKESYLKNLMNANTFWLQYDLNKLNKPVDRDEWDMYPQTYNAYYNPSNNEIVLPAGIFTVPGFRDEELDDALVYGYAGASTIGHEITHGFDDEGRQFDAKGNLFSWWTKEDEEKFNKRAEVMVKQFDNYVVIDTFKINGKATLGENIADLGGILLGWEAFTKTEQYKKNEKIAGLTPAQRYFLGYALGWLQNTRPEALRNQVLTDVHSPAKFRVNGPFSNVDAFYKTFNVNQNNKMFIADSARVRIW